MMTRNDLISPTSEGVQQLFSPFIDGRCLMLHSLHLRDVVPTIFCSSTRFHFIGIVAGVLLEFFQTSKEISGKAKVGRGWKEEERKRWLENNMQHSAVLNVKQGKK